MKTRMIIKAGVIGILIMIPILTQAQPHDTLAVARLYERCPSMLNLVAVTGEVIEIYTPRVISANEMEVRFRISAPKSNFNCFGFKFTSDQEEVKSVFAALLSALNSCKLKVTFCCSFGTKTNSPIVVPIGHESKPEWKDWRNISSLSVKIE